LLGFSLKRAAAGIIDIVNEKMHGLQRLRGEDLGVTLTCQICGELSLVVTTRQNRPNYGVLSDGAKPSPGLLVVRRIQYRLDGKMAVRCDNSKYPEEVYVLESQDLPVPVGLVVWRGGRV
jgi:hypothetical protein